MNTQNHPWRRQDANSVKLAELIAVVKELLEHDYKEGIFDDVSDVYDEGDGVRGGGSNCSQKLTDIMEKLKAAISDA